MSGFPRVDTSCCPHSKDSVFHKIITNWINTSSQAGDIAHWHPVRMVLWPCT